MSLLFFEEELRAQKRRELDERRKEEEEEEAKKKDEEKKRGMSRLLCFSYFGGITGCGCRSKRRVPVERRICCPVSCCRLAGFGTVIGERGIRKRGEGV